MINPRLDQDSQERVNNIEAGKSIQIYTEKQPVILVVDDEEKIIKLLKVNLSIDGYQVVTASDGTSAMESFVNCPPDLVIMDIMMPKIDGFQVLDLLRRRSNVPVIITTAKWDMTLLDPVGLSADSYLKKPFSINELTSLVKTKLKNASKQVSEV